MYIYIYIYIYIYTYTNLLYTLSTCSCPIWSISVYRCYMQFMIELRSVLLNQASSSCDVQTYPRYAELFRCPSCRILESSTPALAAVVTAPMRKLWPANLSQGKPTAASASLT